MIENQNLTYIPLLTELFGTLLASCYRTIRYNVNVKATKYGSCGFETLREYRRAGMLLREKPNRLESGLADGGYTFFGRFFDGLLESRGYNQSTFAAECRRRNFKVGRPGKQRDVGQRSISDWMRGLTVCPREIPTYADAILILSDIEWTDFGLAYAYGQTIPEWKFEDLLEFRKFYRAELSEENTDSAEKV